MIIEVQDLKKSFGGVDVLKGINCSVDEKQVVCVIGPSGSGKSTFLRCLNKLEKADGGRIVIDGNELTSPDTKITEVRKEIGMVFQQFNLFPQMTVLENIMLAPIKVRKCGKDEARKRAEELLKKVGLESKADSYPGQLSGGQQQRVALARTLAQNPQIILADEPVASLDPVTAKQVMDDFQRINRDMHITVLINIHHVDLALQYATRVIGIRAGRVVYDGPAGEVDGAVLDAIYQDRKEATA